MKKIYKNIIMLTFLVTIGAPHTAQAQDTIFTRLKNNIIDTLLYRKLSLAASAGLGALAHKSSHPLARYGLGAASLLNLLRTYAYAPNRYTLEGIAEKAAHDVIGFTWGLLDVKSSNEVDQTRVRLILAMEDLAQNQDIDLKNDVLALKLAINSSFMAISKENKKDPNVDLAVGWALALKSFFKEPSQIQNNQVFKTLRSKFDNLEGIVKIASHINPLKPVNQLGRTLNETLPINNYIYYRDQKDPLTAIKTLIAALEELKNRTTNASLSNDISALIGTAKKLSFDELDELVRNPNTIKNNPVYINIRSKHPGVY